MSAHSHINMPIGAAQALLVRRSARLLKRALAQTDERSKLEGEVIGGIDVIKCSAWEVPHSRHPRQTFKKLQVQRCRLEGEVTGGIDVIKCSAWEVGSIEL